MFRRIGNYGNRVKDGNKKRFGNSMKKGNSFLPSCEKQALLDTWTVSLPNLWNTSSRACLPSRKTFTPLLKSISEESQIRITFPSKSVQILFLYLLIILSSNYMKLIILEFISQLFNVVTKLYPLSVEITNFSNKYQIPFVSTIHENTEVLFAPLYC